jgi:hypothetical protein
MLEEAEARQGVPEPAVEPGTVPPRYVETICGRCRGPAGPEGAWCEQCIRTCRDYTEWLDFQRLPELNSDSLAWAAIFYARAGIPVHPLLPGSKVPASKNGVKDASTDLRLIRNHWRDYPHHNIGRATGYKFDVLDVDTKDGRPGPNSLARLRLSGLTRDAWAAAITPSSGRHILFTPSGDGNHSNAASGLDWLATSLQRRHTRSKSLNPAAKLTSTQALISGNFN